MEELSKISKRVGATDPSQRQTLRKMVTGTEQCGLAPEPSPSPTSRVCPGMSHSEQATHFFGLCRVRAGSQREDMSAAELPATSVGYLAHLPPSHEAVQAVRFLSTLGIRLSHFIDEKSKARRRNMTCKSELIMTAHFKHFEQKQYMINSTFRASRGGLPSQVHRAPQSTVPGCGCWPLCLGLRAAPRAAHRGCGNLGSCLLGAIPSVEGTTLCTPTAPADISLHLNWLSKGDLTKINANHMAGVKCTDWFRPRGPTWWVRVAENRTSVFPKAVGSAMGRRMRSSHAGRLWRVHHTRLDSLGPLDPSSAHLPCRQRAPRRPAPAPGREQMSLQQTVLGLRQKGPG